MFLLRLLLVAMIIYLPNQLRFPPLLDLKGLNSLNIMFFGALLLMSIHGVRARTPAPMKRSIYFLFFMLTWAVFIGIVRDPSMWVIDLTVWKNCIFYILLYFIFYHAATDKKTFWQYFCVLMLVAFVAGIQGVRQGLDYGIGNYNETHRASGPFGHDYRDANRAAAFYVIFVPMFLALALYARKKLHRLVALACFAVGTLGTLFTYSRQAFFILAASCTLLALRKSLLLTVLLALALVNYESWVPEGVVDRIAMTSTDEDDGERKLDESTESRFLLWEGAAKLREAHPFGIGLNHFKREIGRYVPPGLAGYDAHNNYVLFSTEGSILAGVAMVVLLLRLLWLGWQLQRDPETDAKMLGISYMLAVLGVIAGNLYGSRFFDGDVIGNFWILTGLIARYRSIRLEETAAATAGEPLPADELQPLLPARDPSQV